MKKIYELKDYEGYLTAFHASGYGYPDGTCAVPRCEESVEENSNSTWCKSCRANPDAVLKRLGLPSLEEDENSKGAAWVAAVHQRLIDRRKNGHE
jgi:hypothetical protein